MGAGNGLFLCYYYTAFLDLLSTCLAKRNPRRRRGYLRLLPHLPLQVDQCFQHLVGSGDDPVGELVGVFCAVIACMEIGFVLQCDRKGVCHSERRAEALSDLSLRASHT